MLRNVVFVFIYLLKPVGYSHHDVEGAEKENKMEIAVAVDCAVSLIILHILPSSSLLIIIVLWKI